MPLKSMTGYGRATASIGNTELTLEASTVNRRGFELFVSAPPEWAGTLERLASGWARESIARGKLTLLFQLPQGGENNSLAWETAAVRESLRKIKLEADALGIAFSPSADTLLRLVELHRSRRENLPSLDDADTQAALQTLTKNALAQLVTMRLREGAFLEKDLSARIANIEALLARINTHSADTVARYREGLLARLQQAGLALDLSDERVLKEIAIFADRCDIAEETTRLRSHLGQFRDCLGEAQDVGRKLDFLCQEINRELNTIGSKANHLEITRCIIEGKNELERIREQVQNVE